MKRSFGVLAIIKLPYQGERLAAGVKMLGEIPGNAISDLAGGKSTLVKAAFDVREGDNQELIKVMFNPDEYSLGWAVKWADKPDFMPEFNITEPGNLTLNLVYDTSASKKDVRRGDKGTDKIVSLAMPTVVAGKTRKRPPRVAFIWGKFTFEGIVEKVDQKFTMFLPDGTPVRAKLAVTMKPVLDQKDWKKLKGIKESRKFYTVRMGDRLDLIALSQLNDASLWAVIADLNQIEDPLGFPAENDYGRILIIPHLES